LEANECGRRYGAELGVLRAWLDERQIALATYDPVARALRPCPLEPTGDVIAVVDREAVEARLER
jgi:hypothetical protein